MKIEDHLGKIISIVILMLGLAGLYYGSSNRGMVTMTHETGNPLQEQNQAEETDTGNASNTDYDSEPESADLQKQIETETAQSEESAQTHTDTESESETEPPVYFRENREISQYAKVIMVGDSRFVGMSSAVSFAGCQWICEVGEGVDWLSETAAPLIDEAVEENCAIVFNLGVNDVERYSDYVNFLNSRVDGWTSAGADVYFMSVNPVDGAYAGPVTNAAIVTFNDVMSSNLSPWFGYIDTYNDLTTNGFTTRDGLHYTNETYVSIFQYCMNQLHVVIS